MDERTSLLENLRRQRKEIDDILERKESECRELRFQRSALECAIAMIGDDDNVTSTSKSQA